MVQPQKRKVVFAISIIKYDEEKKIKLILDQKELDEYLEYYFDKHPMRRVDPIENPVHPSINQWTVNNHHARNTMKQRWHGFIKWFIDKYELGDYGIERCTMECILTFPTRHRRDPDNYTHKFINDGLVESGFMNDDSFDNIEKVTYEKVYEKGVYKTEITVNILEMEGKFE